PVGEWKDADTLPLIVTAVIEAPKLRTLIPWVPLPGRIPEGVNALLGPRLLLVPACSAEGRIKAAVCQRIEKRARLQQPAAPLGSKRVGIGAFVQSFAVGMHDQLCADLGDVAVAELDHFRKLIARIYVQQGEWDFSGIECLLRQAQHHRRVITNRVQHYGKNKFRYCFPQNEDAFCFEFFEMSFHACHFQKKTAGVIEPAVVSYPLLALLSTHSHVRPCS